MGSIYCSCHLRESPSVSKTLYYQPELCCRGMFNALRLHYSIALTTSWVIEQHVDIPTPNRCEIDLYSRLVANLQIQIATRMSTGTACLYLVFWRVSQGRRVTHSRLKLPLRILKFFSHSWSIQVLLMQSHQLLLRGYVHMLLCNRKKDLFGKI